MGREWNPNTAGWLVAQRGKRKQDEIVAALAERGHQVSRAWLSRIENGAPFSDELLAAFIDLYGSTPPPNVGGAQEPPLVSEAVTGLLEMAAALVRRLDAQVSAMNDLVVELRELSLRAPTAGPNAADLDGQVRALRAEVQSIRLGLGTEGPPVPHVPHTSEQ